MIKLGFLSLAALAFGAALLPFTMFGLLGFPVVLGAAIGCIGAALGLGRTASISPLKNALGIALIVLGVVALVFAIGSATVTTHTLVLNYGLERNVPVGGFQQWMVFGTLLLVSPSLVVLGVACRTDWSLKRRLYLYGVLLAVCLLAVLLFLLMAWMGLPLSA